MDTLHTRSDSGEHQECLPSPSTCFKPVNLNDRPSHGGQWHRVFADTPLVPDHQHGRRAERGSRDRGGTRTALFVSLAVCRNKPPSCMRQIRDGMKQVLSEPGPGSASSRAESSRRTDSEKRYRKSRIATGSRESDCEPFLHGQDHGRPFPEDGATHATHGSSFHLPTRLGEDTVLSRPISQMRKLSPGPSCLLSAVSEWWPVTPTLGSGERLTVREKQGTPGGWGVS